MNLILRYLAFMPLTFFLPLFVLIPNAAISNSALDLMIRLLSLPIYCCLATFLMTSFDPPRMRARLQATPTRLDDLHLWLAPILVILAFLWAGFCGIGALALAEFDQSHPLVFLLLTIGATVLAIWMGIRVRRAFMRSS